MAAGSQDTSLWAGVSESAYPALLALRRKVDAALESVSIAFNWKPLKPHVTLSRIKKPDAEKLRKNIRAGQLSQLELALSEPIPLPVKKIALFQSHLTQEGAKYEIIQEWKLSPSPQPWNIRR